MKNCNNWCVYVLNSLNKGFQGVKALSELRWRAVCDESRPHGSGQGKRPRIYSEPESYLLSFKAKLILKGIPENEIAFVQDCKTDKQKQQLFAKVRSGAIRVVFGSTETMGAGTNIQNKLIALHHLDCPWRPRDLEQREKRIHRRGNENPLVRIFRYVTKDTFDVLW